MARITDPPVPSGTYVSSLGMKPGRYYQAPAGAAATLLTVDQRVFYVPFNVGKPQSVDRIGVEVVSPAGSAGSVIRLGIYADDGTNNPGALLLDAGTVLGTGVGFVAATISQALPAGRVWLACVAQGAPATSPTLRSVGSNTHDPTIGFMAAGDGYATGYFQLGIAGALPANATLNGDGSGMPFIAVRAV